MIQQGQPGERGPKGDAGSPYNGSDNYPPGTPIWMKVLLVALQKFGVATIILLGACYYILIPLANTYQEFIKVQSRVSESQADTLKSLKDSEIARLKAISDAAIVSKVWQDKSEREHAVMIEGIRQQLVDHKLYMEKLAEKKP
jgi:hypothetical protein